MANYTTDADLEDYIPDILDHGIPGILDGGLKTTLTANAVEGGTTITVAAVTGLAAGDNLKVDSDANVEIVTVGSINSLIITLDEDTPLRKEHRSGVKVTQVNSSSFAGDHAEAKDDIDRIIDLGWYRPQVRARTGSTIELLGSTSLFNPALMLNASIQLKKLSAYRALGWYICPKLAKFTDENDTWGNRALDYRAKFEEELERVLAIGIDYDWNNSGIIEDSERGLGTSGFRIGRA